MNFKTNDQENQNFYTSRELHKYLKREIAYNGNTNEYIDFKNATNI
jgi:predicted lipid-binding transport protein (Tim44 family)